MPTAESKEKPAEPAIPEDTGRSLLRSASIVGLLTILSRLTGLWRFRVIGATFGASGVADAFYLAFVFPNITRRLFGEGAMTSAFVPVFSHHLANGQHEAAHRTASILVLRLAYWLSLGCVGLGALAVALRYILPQVVNLSVSDVLAIKLFIAMLPYMVCINVAAVLMAILNSLKHFAIPAFAPVILNVLLILACYFALPYFGSAPEQQIWALAAAVLAGGLLQVFVQIPPLLARGFKPRVTLDKTDPGYREVMGNFLPVVLLVAVFQANVMIDNIIAAIFIPGDGPVTYLNMGTSVYQLPWSIFSLALGTAALPALSELWARNRKEEFTSTLLTALRMTIFLAVPCTVGIMLLSEDIVRLLYGAGKFLENDGEPIRRTASVVMFSSLGLVFFSLNSVLARALYAMKDMKTPTTTSAKSVAINLVLNLVFVLGTDMREGGIALASTISNAWQTWALIRALQGRMNPDGTAKFGIPSGLLSLAGAAAIATAAGFIGFSKAGAIWKAVGLSGDVEGFVPMLLGAALALGAFHTLGKQYFASNLKGKPQEASLSLRMGVAEEHWSDWLKFEYALFATLYASAVMGFVVWAVRDSVPPEGRTTLLVLQRSIIPVIVGMLAYSTVCSSVLSREYEELKAALRRRKPSEVRSSN